MSQIPFVTQLGDELEAAIAADQAPRQATRRQRSRLPVLAAFAPLVLTAVALAATGILFGSAYSPPWAKRTPQAHLGVPVAGSVRLLSLRVADPAGGPPWGMRVMRTTRGYECVQVGRVLDRQLGVIGQDGWFGDDHRFHPMPPSAFGASNCSILGAGGYALIGSWETGLASAVDVVGKCAYPGSQGSGPPLPVCPASDLRFLAYGLVGPDARAITYGHGGGHRALSTVGPEGAYLLVRGARSIVVVHGAGAGGAGLAGGGGPGSFPGAVAILYRNGHTCPAQDPPGTNTCPYGGFRLAGARRLHLRAVHVRLSVRPAGKPFGAGYSEVVLHFRAPIAVRSGALDYTVAAANPGLGGPSLSSLDRDIRKGAKVALGVTVPDCTRAFVKLYLARANPMAQPEMASPSPVATLATLKIDLPTAQHPAWCR